MIYDQLITPDSRSYIINQSLNAYRIFVDNGKQFSISAEMKEEQAQYMSQSSMMDFVQTVLGCTEQSEVAKAICNDPEYSYTTELYSAYVEYSRATLSQPMSRKRFVEKIRNEYNLKTKTTYFVTPDGKKTTRTKYVCE